MSYSLLCCGVRACEIPPPLRRALGRVMTICRVTSIFRYVMVVAARALVWQQAREILSKQGVRFQALVDRTSRASISLPCAQSQTFMYTMHPRSCCCILLLLDYDSPIFSKSRIITAICARFAASATRVKSLRKASVEAAALCDGAGGGGGGGATKPWWFDWGCDQVDVEAVCACWWVGEEIGAFIFALW